MVVLDQVGHPQVFMVDHIVRLHQLVGFLVVEAAALPGDVLLGLRPLDHRLLAAMAPFAPAGDATLAAAQGGWLPVGERGEGLQPPGRSRSAGP
jgi:hypothetical protein